VYIHFSWRFGCWLLAIDTPDASKFIVEGEKRYWLRIALGRDLVSGNVDVLGTQLEEVTE